MGSGALERRETVSSTGSSALNEAQENLVRHSTVMKNAQQGIYSTPVYTLSEKDYSFLTTVYTTFHGL